MRHRDDIHREVDRFYRDIALGKHKTEVSAEELYLSLGYTKDQLDHIPKGVDLGLSCGNPIEKLLLRPGETLLDLGSGAGMDVFLTRVKFPKAGMLYGVDRLPEMVDKATAAAAKKGFSGVAFRVGTLTDLPFEAASIDWVISNCVINLEPDKEKVYREIERVLTPGGRAIISDILLKQPLSEELRRAENLYGT